MIRSLVAVAPSFRYCSAVPRRALVRTAMTRYHSSDAHDKKHDPIHTHKEDTWDDAQQRQRLKAEAGFLTRSLYRTCLRSVRLIRPGNQYDEEEFQRREAELERKATNIDPEDIRLGTFSMLPPVDRQDELHSRAEYYHQFARENVHQETDCLPLGDQDVGTLQPYDVERFVYLMKKGERDRKWLLQDMQFEDPYAKSFPKQRLKQFEASAMDYIQEKQRRQQHGQNRNLKQEQQQDDNLKGDPNFWDDEEEEVPQWIKDRYPHMVSQINPKAPR